MQVRAAVAWMAFRQSLLASAVVAGCSMALPAVGQTALNAPTAVTTAEPPVPAPAENASVARSAMKATTFKAGSTAVNLAILSYATGGVAGGALLATFQLAASWVMYTANDYLWDKYSPPPPKQPGQKFDTNAELWRTTEKYMTYKPVIAMVKLATLYAYTGSARVTAVFGGATIVANGLVFYVNNMAWDLYDWYFVPAPPPAVRADRLVQEISTQPQR
jgi:uncharacterized membrane protein